MIDVKPIKSASKFDVDIKFDIRKSELSGITSSIQSQCCKPAQPVSSDQSTPVSASGLAN